MPTAPSPSPTTVSAAKPSMRPPFTTLVTRFTDTIFSFRPSLRWSPPCILDCCLAIVIPLYDFWVRRVPQTGPARSCPLEFEPGFPRCVRQSLYPAVILVAGTVESDLADAQHLRLFGDALANDARRRLVAAAGQLAAQILLRGRSARQHLVALGRKYLGVNVAVGAVHAEPHRFLLMHPAPGLSRAAQPRGSLLDHDCPSRYFFFVSLSTTCSPV